MTTSANYLKTFLLFAGMTALLLFAGHLIGGPQMLAPMLVVAVVVNFATFWFSDRVVLKMYQARPIQSGELPWLQRSLEHLSKKADIPTPRLFLIDNPQPNAFAVGATPAKGAVAINTGLLDILSPREVEGVVAHELAHIKNRDTLIMTVAGVVAGMFSYLAHLGPWLALGGNDEEEGANPLAVLAIGLVGGVAATIIQLAISRSREYGADAVGASLTGDPEALASALERLEYGASRIGPVRTNEGTAHLMIVNPLRGGRLSGMFSTHPPIPERAARLRAMAGAAPGRAGRAGRGYAFFPNATMR
jgi:heat shock protein HtpX